MSEEESVGWVLYPIAFICLVVGSYIFSDGALLGSVKLDVAAVVIAVIVSRAAYLSAKRQKDVKANTRAEILKEHGIINHKPRLHMAGDLDLDIEAGFGYLVDDNGTAVFFRDTEIVDCFLRNDTTHWVQTVSDWQVIGNVKYLVTLNKGGEQKTYCVSAFKDETHFYSAFHDGLNFSLVGIIGLNLLIQQGQRKSGTVDSKRQIDRLVAHATTSSTIRNAKLLNQAAVSEETFIYAWPPCFHEVEGQPKFVLVLTSARIGLLSEHQGFHELRLSAITDLELQDRAAQYCISRLATVSGPVTWLQGCVLDRAKALAIRLMWQKTRAGSGLEISTDELHPLCFPIF